jgi:hypothetical protein
MEVWETLVVLRAPFLGGTVWTEVGETVFVLRQGDTVCSAHVALAPLAPKLTVGGLPQRYTGVRGPSSKRRVVRYPSRPYPDRRVTAAGDSWPPVTHCPQPL